MFSNIVLEKCFCTRTNYFFILKEKLEVEKIEHECEVAKLRELLSNIECDARNYEELRQELEEKHEKEMEEVRTYFEQKCADLGKQ